MQTLSPYTAKNKFEDTMIRYIRKVLMDLGKEDYADEEEFSAIFPLSWEFRFQFLEVFNLMEYAIRSILEFPNIIKELTKHPATLSEYSIRYCIRC
ncbi:3127_t:CDS:2 [Funneliformis mosseae]|uniref:3127_t:CDS:1 n=1 Tax=Funneliformis mosseae TaxID=27381 RepID=A0A9N9FYQ8_FUNMO|nr:3127_t:CDS:2 [Funneliformis mosseae]